MRTTVAQSRRGSRITPNHLRRGNGRGGRQHSEPSLRVDPRERTLHLVDLENLLGDPRATGPGVGRALERYAEVSGWRRADLVYVAANPRLALEVGFCRSFEFSLRARRGPHGADLELLSQARPDFVARRAGRLVIGSGDGIFARSAREARDRGVEVLVVARPGSLNRVYRDLGFEVVAFVPPGGAAVAA